MTRYEVIESKRWKRDDGRTASIYGACPWTSEAERARWQMETAGFTVRNLSDGTVGIGRVPWKERETAQKWVDTRDSQYLPQDPPRVTVF